MKRGKVEFNEIPVGSVAKFGICEFVKICNAEINISARLQSPNAVDLSDHHYIVIAAHAVCEIIKTPRDPQYNRQCDSDLLFDCDK